jgi:hypothetical protein
MRAEVIHNENGEREKVPSIPANAIIVASGMKWRNAAATNMRGFFRRWMKSRRAAEEKLNFRDKTRIDVMGLVRLRDARAA